MSRSETHAELRQLEDVLNYLAAEYQFEKHERKRKAAFAQSRRILQLDQKTLDEYPWIQWRSLWEWLDYQDESGRTFLEWLLAEEKELPYPEILMKLLFTRVGVYQVVGLHRKNEMTLKDAVTSEVYRVQVDEEDLQLPWTILVGRLYPLGGGVWTGIQEWISFPPYFQLVLQEWLKRHFPNKAPEEQLLKKLGLELIRLAANPPENAGEEFLLIMDQLQEILLEDRGRFEQNVERLPEDIQRLIYQTLHYTLWFSAVRTGSDQFAFPWEEKMAQLGIRGEFVPSMEVRQQLKENLKEEGAEEEEDAFFWNPDSLNPSGRAGEAEPAHGEEEGVENLPAPLERTIADFQQGRTEESWTVSLFGRYLRTVTGEIRTWTDLDPEHMAEFLGWWVISRRVVKTEDQALQAIREMEEFLEWLDRKEGTGKKELCRPVMAELNETLPLAIGMNARCREVLGRNEAERPYDYNWYRIERVDQGFGTAIDRETDEQLEVRWDEELSSVFQPGFIVQGNLFRERSGYRLDAVMHVYPPLAWEYVR